MERRREYLDWTSQVVQGCRGANAGLESYYDEVLQAGYAKLEMAALSTKTNG
jgi:hypothetical protein